MDNITSEEGLRVWIINRLADSLGRHAILKGGMVLRVLGCPRFTNDVDYIFIPYRSKKEIVPLVEKGLKDLPGLEISHRFHSTNVRFDISTTASAGTFHAVIEGSVADECPSQPLSTGELAVENHQSPQIVSVMRFDVALAHKLASWLERSLMRDLYDAHFIFKNLNVIPNRETLEKRLQKISYAKCHKGKTRPKSLSLKAFLEMFEAALDELDEKQLEEELRDTLTQEQLIGLEKRIKISLRAMIEEMQRTT